MPVDAGTADAAGTPQHDDQVVHGGELGRGWTLALEVAQKQDADIAFVVAHDVGAFVGKRACFPDASDIVNCQMIGYIAVAAGAV